MIKIRTLALLLAMLGSNVFCTSGQKECSGNLNLMKSIQYQLKLVEENGQTCACEKEGYINQFIVVIYDSVDVNFGNGYDTSSGIFTAPEDGVYYFSWTTETVGSKFFMTHLAVNNKPIAKNYANAKTASGSAIVKMTKGDNACIKVDHGEGEYMHNERWSFFNGFKI